VKQDGRPNLTSIMGILVPKQLTNIKSAKYYKLIREWSDKKQGKHVFYFEAFDEQWKDAANPKGSENHFGLINLQSQAKICNLGLSG
jgi:hypothetical protein